jgi:hypothetical protein
MIANMIPPIWPTGRPVIDNACKGSHPNVATAGFDKNEKKSPLNAGHSEYYLLYLALEKMLKSYRTNEQSNCPGAAFLYTVNSPCSSCHWDIRKAKERVFDKQCQNMPFYVGYTDVYQKDYNTWKQIEALLGVNGINVIEVPKQ